LHHTLMSHYVTFLSGNRLKEDKGYFILELPLQTKLLSK